MTETLLMIEDKFCLKVMQIFSSNVQKCNSCSVAMLIKFYHRIRLHTRKILYINRNSEIPIQRTSILRCNNSTISRPSSDKHSIMLFPNINETIVLKKEHHSLTIMLQSHVLIKIPNRALKVEKIKNELSSGDAIEKLNSPSTKTFIFFLSFLFQPQYTCLYDVRDLKF